MRSVKSLRMKGQHPLDLPSDRSCRPSMTEDPWTAAMRRGDFASAWRVSDAHLEERTTRGETNFAAPRHLQNIWDGQPLAGRRVLVRCYHGLGDTVQFVRFFKPLRRLAGEVSVWAQPSLLPLVGTARGVDRVLPLHDGAPPIEYDADIEIMELAHALRIDLGDLPGEVPYLFPTEQPKDFSAHHETHVGLVWSAGDWDRRRTISPEELCPLADISGVHLHSLQRGRAAAHAGVIPAADTSSDDIATLTATLRGLDLLICVDTFVAHLAGALRVPVWLLLHKECDWRWMERGDRTPWYPSMRLFRQRSQGDWRDVIAEVAEELRRTTQKLDSRGIGREQTNKFDVRPS
jgi:hypothetical protein